MTQGNGNTLGVRAYFAYTSDSGDVYSIQLDESLGLAAGLTKDVLSSAAPRRFEPRCVWLEATVDGRKVRKRLVCNSDFASYDTEQTSTVTVEGVAFQVTGRTGEKMTFPRNPVATDPT